MITLEAVRFWKLHECTQLATQLKLTNNETANCWNVYALDGLLVFLSVASQLASA